MIIEPIAMSPTAQSVLRELAVRTGRTAADVLETALEEYRRKLADGIGSIPGIDPADIWEANAQADAGRLTPHDELFARLRAKP